MSSFVLFRFVMLYNICVMSWSSLILPPPVFTRVSNDFFSELISIRFSHRLSCRCARFEINVCGAVFNLLLCSAPQCAACMSSSQLYKILDFEAYYLMQLE